MGICGIKDTKVGLMIIYFSCGWDFLIDSGFYEEIIPGAEILPGNYFKSSMGTLHIL